MSKPSIVLVPGSWHHPKHYQDLLDNLKHSGYETEISLIPTTHAEHDKASQDLPDDVEFVKKTLHKYLDQNKHVVLLGHSYGAIPAMIACDGLDPESRKADGKSSSITAIGFIPGAIPPPGFALADMFGGKSPPFCDVKDGLSMPTGGKGPAHLFYNDIPEEKAKEHIPLFKSQSVNIHFTRAPDVLAHCKNIAIGYIICTKDNAQNPVGQYKTVQGLMAKGMNVYAEEADSGHSVFISKSEETARFVRKLAGENIETGFKPYKPE